LRRVQQPARRRRVRAYRVHAIGGHLSEVALHYFARRKFFAFFVRTERSVGDASHIKLFIADEKEFPLHPGTGGHHTGPRRHRLSERSAPQGCNRSPDTRILPPGKAQNVPVLERGTVVCELGQPARMAVHQLSKNPVSFLNPSHSRYASEARKPANGMLQPRNAPVTKMRQNFRFTASNFKEGKHLIFTVVSTYRRFPDGQSPRR